MRILITLVFTLFLFACQNPPANPKLATMPYPMDKHTATSVPIQVIRTEEHIDIINSTADDYIGAQLWVNQRYTMKMPPCRAGTTVRINLWNLRDSFGEQFNAGGVWRTDEPTRLVIAELQTSSEDNLVGLVVIGED
ncbi:MAG: hypothetical protein QF718_06715 [Phycisphaerales bacterium]|jgi:hypothetical protein|nr:hypothetical protein [Phycisphaerales bacterium]